MRIEKDSIKNTDRLVEDLGADSIEMAEVLMTIEEKFGLYISDEDAYNIKTVQDVADYLDKI